MKDVTIVLPSRRAGVFVREACTDQISVGFLPLIQSIEEFVSEVSQCEKIETIELLFYFFEVYQKTTRNPQSFDQFASWALTALQDFSEADQYLVNPKDLFTYVRDIKRLQKWSVDDNIPETDLMKAHYDFVERLGDLYQTFSKELLCKKKGYAGLIFRQAVAKLDGFLDKRKDKAYYFIGFNALTKSEEVLIQRVLQHPKSEIFWDIDTQFLHSNHQAGSFIRKYIKEWRYYEQNDLKRIGNHFGQEKNIQVIGATKNITQIKEAGNILSTFDSFRNTALVLGDESLLSVVLNSLPDKVPAINITMGYALKDMPAYQFVKAYFELYLTREKMQLSQGIFYHKSLLKLLANPLLNTILDKTEKDLCTELIDTIQRENMSFVPRNAIEAILQKSALSKLFLPDMNVQSFLEQMVAFIDKNKERVSALEREYLFRFYTSFQQLQHLNKQFQFFDDLKVLYAFFRQIVGKETLSFQGEPLSGLQIMGVLETRVLDFENVIVTSMNEGIIPKNSHQSSFVPFDVKLSFGLPTYKEKDAIFSYHIFRLLQRAKNIYLLYNSESDEYGNGEKSRFIAQMAMMRSDINFRTLSPKIPKTTEQPIRVNKSLAVINQLQRRAEKGFSPSAIGSYLYNPLEFYKQKVLGIEEQEEVEETMAANTMGSIVHKVLEELYLPYLNTFLTTTHLEDMQQLAQQKIDALFPRYFRKGHFSTGKNKLMYEIVGNYIQRFLRQEKELVASGKTLKILAVEKQMEAQCTVQGIEFPIRLYGEIDRIDLLDGTLRIIDYKTGRVSGTDMAIPDNWTLNHKKYSKAIQVLLYAYMFQQNHPGQYTSVQAGNISFKNLGAGLQRIHFGTRNAKTYDISSSHLDSFIQSLGEIFRELFDLEIPFVENLDKT